MRTRRWLLLLLLGLPLLLPPLAAQPQPEPKKAGPRLDHYGDPLPEHALLRIGTHRLRPGGMVTALAFTADDKQLVTITAATGGHVWEVATGKELRTFGRLPTRDAPGAVSADGTLAAFAESEEICRVYDTATGRVVRAVPSGSANLRALSISTDKKHLASVDANGLVHLWDIGTGTLVRRWMNCEEAENLRAALAFSPDSKTLAVSAYLVRLWDVATGALTHESGAMAFSTWLSFSPDGKNLAGALAGDNGVLENFETGAVIRRLRFDHLERLSSSLSCGCFTSDGKGVLTGDRFGELLLWDLGNKRKSVNNGRGNAVESLCMSHEAKLIATANADGTVRLWDVESGRQLKAYDGHDSHSVKARFTSDGKKIVSTCYGSGVLSDESSTLQFSDAASGKSLQKVRLNAVGVNAYALSGNGGLLAVAYWNTTFFLRTVTTGKEKPLVDPGRPARRIDALDMTNDGRFLVARATVYADSSRESLQVWDLDAAKVIFTVTGKETERISGRFVEGGRFLTIDTREPGDYSKNVPHVLQLWDFRAERKILYRGPPLVVGDFSIFSPNGRLVLPSLDFGPGFNEIPILEVATGKGIRRLRVGGEKVCCIAISPDSALVAGGTDENHLVLWNLASEKPVAKLTGHRARVSSVGFSPDGKRLVSGSDDTTILVWDVSPWADRSAKRDKGLPASDANKLWSDLAEADAAKAQEAIARFLESPTEAVTFLRNRLRPFQPAQAKELTNLLAILDSQRFSDREEAVAKLAKAGHSAVPALEKTLASNPPLEVRLRAQMLLSKLESQPLSAESLQALRALEPLEMLGTPDAAALLDSLSRGEPDAWLTQEAAAPLERVRKRAVH